VILSVKYARKPIDIPYDKYISVVTIPDDTVPGGKKAYLDMHVHEVCTVKNAIMVGTKMVGEFKLPHFVLAQADPRVFASVPRHFFEHTPRRISLFQEFDMVPRKWAPYMLRHFKERVAFLTSLTRRGSSTSQMRCELSNFIDVFPSFISVANKQYPELLRRVKVAYGLTTRAAQWQFLKRHGGEMVIYVNNPTRKMWKWAAHHLPKKRKAYIGCPEHAPSVYRRAWVRYNDATVVFSAIELEYVISYFSSAMYVYLYYDRPDAELLPLLRVYLRAHHKLKNIPDHLLKRVAAKKNPTLKKALGFV